LGRKRLTARDEFSVNQWMYYQQIDILMIFTPPIFAFKQSFIEQIKE
tara:strand:+ start:1019 stop:1159 length:141 start_codon:yes stop_codon:yes gene_type:complete